MHGDLSRWTFQPDRHYSRVVVQQGRVTLDADANAQASILLHYMRTLAGDLIGPFGGPSGDDLGFKIASATRQGEPSLTVGTGRYYVDGLLCEADGTPIDYFQQPDGYFARAVPPDTPALPAPPYLVWLKVWERYISWVEDPALREVALGLNGPDTTGRTRIVWQVLASPIPEQVNFPPEPLTAKEFYDKHWDGIEQQLSPRPTGTLTARAKQPPQVQTDTCILPPGSGYRGPENQLYRVEIHRDGALAAAPAPAGTTPAPATPTFMWSRDNGSVILPITGISGAVVSVTTLGRDPQLSVDAGDYVEIVDDAYASQGQPGPIPRYAEPLHLVTSVDPVQLTVTLDEVPSTRAGAEPALRPCLRRWDEQEVLVTKAGLTIDDQDKAIDLVAGQWIDLEDGIQVQFGTGTYRAGDYWLIPARVATGDVEWPKDTSGQQPAALLPMGVEYHLAPLAIVYPGLETPVDVRKKFPPSAQVLPAPAAGATAEKTDSDTGPAQP